MAYMQDRQVTLGQLMNGSFAQLSTIRRELAIYFGAFFVIGLIADFVSFLRGPIAIAATIGYFAGQYWLYRTALERAGVLVDPRWKVFGLFGMAAILSFPILFGMNLLFIPGLLLAAKWIMAPSFLVAGERNLFEAMGDAWRASGNNLMPLTLGVVVMGFIWFACVVAAGMVGAAFDAVVPGGGGEAGANAIEWLGIHALPVLLMGLSIAAYRALADADTSIAAVFE